MKCISDLMLDDYAWWCSWSSFNCFLTSGMLHRPVLGDLPVHLTLRSSSNHVICMIINYFLHGYIRTSLIHLETLFYSFFLLYLWGWPKCVSHYLELYNVYPCYKLWFTLQACHLVPIHTRLFTPCLPLEKYK